VTGKDGYEVTDLAALFEVPVSSAQAAAIASFLALLLRWNERINLTGARFPEELRSEHLPDSFALARLLPSSSRVADVGSGGGLPALPTAILRPDVSWTLFEARSKRQAFLRTAVRELSLSSVVIAGRLDPAAPTQPSFDAATSRATFEPAEWIATARRMVNAGGTMIVFDAGRPWNAGGAQPIDTIEYRTGEGHRRRATSYRST
jgi:16S rRNA (guanine527-N7)-methyltransferase